MQNWYIYIYISNNSVSNIVDVKLSRVLHSSESGTSKLVIKWTKLLRISMGTAKSTDISPYSNNFSWLLIVPIKMHSQRVGLEEGKAGNSEIEPLTPPASPATSCCESNRYPTFLTSSFSHQLLLKQVIVTSITSARKLKHGWNLMFSESVFTWTRSVWASSVPDFGLLRLHKAPPLPPLLSLCRLIWM